MFTQHQIVGGGSTSSNYIGDSPEHTFSPIFVWRQWVFSSTRLEKYRASTNEEVLSPPIEPEPSTSAQADNEDVIMQNRGKHAASDDGAGPSAKRTGKAADPVGTGSAIPRPMTRAGPTSISFQKVHRFVSYGIPNKIFELDIHSTANTTHNWILMTSLMNIPWDKPYFYLYPSEFAMLPNNSICTSLHCEVKYRNTRQAFDQSNDIISAVGLNKFFDGMNFEYSGTVCRASQTFSSCSVLPDDHDKKIAEKMWGVSQDVGHFSTTTPHSVVGTPMTYNCYYGLTSDSANPNNVGWPALSDQMQIYDSQASVGQVICRSSYKPIVGNLKKPSTSICRPYSGFKDRAEMFDLAQVPMFNDIAGNCKVKSEKQATTCLNSDKFSYHDTIEKSQFVGKVNGLTHEPSSQHWIHVGIMPSKAVNANDIISSSENYTDVQANFEVTATMEVSYSFSTHFTHAKIPNVLSENDLVRPGNVT